MARGRWTLRLLFSAALLLLLLALAELLLWATGLMSDPQDFQFRRMTRAVAEDPEGRYVADPTLFYALAPHHRHGSEHLGRDATGDWPFRGRPAEPAPPGLLRVAIVGDSCVYGASLDVASMLGTRVQAGLTARGLTADRVQVLSFGVPGYSTVQLAVLLDQVLERWHPDAVVLYPAAWNDQAPALRRSDEELLQELTHPTPLEWLRNHTRVVGALLHVLDRVPAKEIMDGWNAGHPPRGWRVSAEDVGRNVAAMLARCAQAGVPCVVIAPPHPEKTLADHPRTGEDAATVLRVAREAGVPAIDGQAALRDARLDLGHDFVDYIHPSPEGVDVLAPLVADAVLKALLASPVGPTLGTPAPAQLAIARVEPATASVLGDVPLRVTLAGWTDAEPPPAVIVGGAPLIGVHAVSPDTVEGTLMTNAAGLHDVVVQDARGCALLPGGLARLDPRIALQPGPPRTFVISGRPGDRYQIFVAGALRDVPEWTLRGAYRLDPAGAKQLPQSLTADEHGNATLAVPELSAARVFVQALVTPRGEGPGNSLASRWTAPVELEVGP